MASDSQTPSPEQTRQAALAVADALGPDEHYAIVGGAACSMLGSQRVTCDVDVVVPQGGTRAARARLKAQETLFEVERRTNHTTFRGSPPIGVEILTPPVLFKQEFTPSTPTIRVNNVPVLKPTLLLDAKCDAIAGRPNDGKRRTDAADIKFLLDWCARNNMRPTPEETPHITKRFVNFFIRAYGGPELWTNAGWDIKKGMLSSPGYRRLSINTVPKPSHLTQHLHQESGSPNKNSWCVNCTAKIRRLAVQLPGRYLPS